MDGGVRYPKRHGADVFLAVRYGKAAPPELVAVQLAEAWGVPPWEIMEAPGSLYWAGWRRVLKEAEAKSRKLDE